MRFLLGGYTADMEGTANGIGVLFAGDAAEQSPRGALAFTGTAAAVASPSWIAHHPTLDVVYAALEGDGAVQAFARREGALRALGRAVPVGEVTCHLAIAPDGSHLYSASYGDGTVARVALNADGTLGAAKRLSPAADPYGDGTTPQVAEGGVDLAAAAAALRAAAGAEFAHLVPEYDAPEAPAEEPTEPAARVSRAHHVTFVPGGTVVTTDLGYDIVRIWRGGAQAQSVTLPKDTGPRHAVWHASGHLYVVTEYSAEVFVLAPTREGEWRVVSAAPVARDVRTGSDFPAEISLTPDGAFVHVGVRGSNAIATLAVRDGGALLEPVALVDSGVDWPRHHVLIGDTMLVAGQRSEEITSLDVDPRTGIVVSVRHRAAAPTPSAILPLWD